MDHRRRALVARLRDHVTNLRRITAMLIGREFESVIWDFNGTLIDDLDLVVRTVNAQLAKRSLPSLTAEDYQDVFGFPVEDYYRRIGVTFEDESMADLSSDFFVEYAPALKDCSLHEGALDTLRQIKARGLRQFILSAMEEGMLRSMIDHFGIPEFFTDVYGLAHQEADSKVTRGQDLLKDFDIDPSRALLIGDTSHDAEVAESLGISAVLVSCGHQSEARLRSAGCPVFSTVCELGEMAWPKV